MEIQPSANQSRKFFLSSQYIIDIEANSRQAVEIYLHPEIVDEDGLTAKHIFDQANRLKDTADLDLFALTCLTVVAEKVSVNNFFVNISPYSLCDKKHVSSLQEKIEDLLKLDMTVILEINPPPVELTGSEYISMYMNCKKLARAGIRFATNPYYRATDVSTHLDAQYTPYLKIARPLLLKAMDSEQVHASVQRDIRIAKMQERMVIGEGVETDDEMQCYKAMGCDWVQGFLISEPNPLFKKGLSLDEYSIYHEE